MTLADLVHINPLAATALIIFAALQRDTLLKLLLSLVGLAARANSSRATRAERYLRVVCGQPSKHVGTEPAPQPHPPVRAELGNGRRARIRHPRRKRAGRRQARREYRVAIKTAGIPAPGLRQLRHTFVSLIS
jgi:hypothetical protein